MREAGAPKPTLTNKQSYIGGKIGFFAWAMNSDYYPQGVSPASGHVTYSIRERRNRRKLGFKAFRRVPSGRAVLPSRLRHASSRPHKPAPMRSSQVPR